MKKYKDFIAAIIYLLGGYRYKTLGLVMLFLCLSLLDLASIGLIIPYVSLITNPELFFKNEYVLNFITKQGFTIDERNDLIVILGLGLVILFAIKAFFSIYINRKILKFCYFRGAELRSLLMHNYQTMPYSDFVQGNSSDYIYAIQNLTMIYSKGTLYAFLKFISESIVALAIVCLLIIIDLEVLFIFAGLMFVLYFLYSYFFMEKIGGFGKLQNKLGIQIIKSINEGIGGLKEIRILRKESFFYNKVKSLSESYADSSVQNRIIQTLPRYLIELILISLIVIIVMLNVFRGEDISLLAPILSVFGVAAIRLTPSINQIIASITQMKHGSHALRLLYKDVKRFDNNVEVKNRENHSYFNPEKPKEVIFNILELKGVSYKYARTSKFAIDNINIKISKGDLIGIVGRSGSGKSTIIDIILGLLKPTKGEVLFNGENLEKCLVQFQFLAAYLPQETFIMDSSLKVNITLDENNNNIDEKKLDNSIERASLNKMIKEMPHGVNSRLGENGVLLSGGQRQRISLARSFYHDRELLIFDESTSALDEKTELEVFNELKKLKGIKTIIIISHRKNVLKDCDYIFDLDSNK